MKTLQDTFYTINKTTLITSLLCGSLVTGCDLGHNEGHWDEEKQVWVMPDGSHNPINTDKPQQSLDKKNNYTDGLNILAYNVYLMNTFLSQWEQDKRATFIAQSDAIKGHDVVILNELFDDGSSKILLDTLQSEYPHQTPILARKYSQQEIDSGDAGTNPQWDQSLGNIDKTGFEDGGVAIISRYPITKQIQYVYKDGCGTDNLGKKGFVYAIIDKNGMDYHIIGTHAQSEDKRCQSGEPSQVRQSQFREIQQFITAKQIPKDKILFIGGDFNVVKSSDEYPQTLQTLQVNAPDVYAGFKTSWDPESNGIASANYPNQTEEYLDYIFVSKNHAQPTYWHNQSLDERSPRWQRDRRFYEELSDHYPIAGFAYADTDTRTHSYRFINRPYAQVTLRTEQNDYLISNDQRKELLINGKADDAGISFNLDNWYPTSQAFCIRHDDYVQLKSNMPDARYWSDKRADSNIYSMAETSLANLRLEIVNDDGDCLKNGDQVLFYDFDTTNNSKNYFYQSPLNQWQLSADGQASATKLTIAMAEGKIDDWSDKLKYQP